MSLRGRCPKQSPVKRDCLSTEVILKNGDCLPRVRCAVVGKDALLATTYIAIKTSRNFGTFLFLWTPARLIITIAIIRQAAQVSAVCADDVELTAMIVTVVIEVGSEHHPFAIW